MTPRSGDVLRVGAAASVQFGTRPILFRVIRVLDVETYDGWVWLDGYELNAVGDAVERRSIFVQLAGLEVGVLSQPPVVSGRNQRNEAARGHRLPRAAVPARSRGALPG